MTGLKGCSVAYSFGVQALFLHNALDFFADVLALLLNLVERQPPPSGVCGATSLRRAVRFPEWLLRCLGLCGFVPCFRRLFGEW